MSGELRPNLRCSRFPRPCNNLRPKIGALLWTKIETRKFALEVAQFSAKKGMPAEICGEGAHGGFFSTVEDTFISIQSPRKWKSMRRITMECCNSCSGIFEWRGRSWSIDGSCTIIMFDHIPPILWKLDWVACKSTQCNTPLIVLIWSHAISGCFQLSRNRCEVVGSVQTIERWMQSTPSWMVFQNLNSRRPSTRNGSNGWTAAFKRHVDTTKESQFGFDSD